jgi:hypothetical protein
MAAYAYALLVGLLLGMLAAAFFASVTVTIWAILFVGSLVLTIVVGVVTYNPPVAKIGIFLTLLTGAALLVRYLIGG